MLMCTLFAYCFFIYIGMHGYAATREQENVMTYEGAQVWRVHIRTEQDFRAIGKLVEGRDIKNLKLAVSPATGQDSSYRWLGLQSKEPPDNTCRFQEYRLLNLTFDPAVGQESLKNLIVVIIVPVISLWRLENTWADFLIQADDQLEVIHLLNARKLNHSVLIADVQRNLDASKVEPPLWTKHALRIGHRLNWTAYPTLSVINEYLVHLSKNYPFLSKVTTIGYSVENRPIKMVKITNGNKKNKKFLIISGFHSREWIAITSTLYVLDKLVTKFDQLPSYMKNIEWIIIPMINPDGYEYSHTSNRFWRKNRQKLEGNAKDCIGVDLNRNFGFNWDVNGVTSKDECSENYSGPFPFSEPETIALLDMVMTSEKKPNAVLCAHSYGQLITYPWTSIPNATKDILLFQATAKAMSEAIKNTTYMDYRIGDAYSKIFPASGTSEDWMYSIGVSLPFAIQLRDKGQYAFSLPPKFIASSGKDLLAAVDELAKVTIHLKDIRLGNFDTSLEEKDNLGALKIRFNVKIDIGRVRK